MVREAGFLVPGLRSEVRDEKAALRHRFLAPYDKPLDAVPRLAARGPAQSRREMAMRYNDGSSVRFAATFCALCHDTWSSGPTVPRPYRMRTCRCNSRDARLPCGVMCRRLPSPVFVRPV